MYFRRPGDSPLHVGVVRLENPLWLLGRKKYVAPIFVAGVMKCAPRSYHVSNELPMVGSAG
ncbi:MAG: hypothetical protein K1X67_01810, partial [Fimbriimonadaceae bacterium]|nr:hypothetical protein [Fimbriimonadaceae bacterium]